MSHGIGHYSDECKVLGDFGTKYAAAQLTKTHGSNRIPKTGFKGKKYNYTIIDNMVDELHMVESKKVSDLSQEAL